VLQYPGNVKLWESPRQSRGFSPINNGGRALGQAVVELPFHPHHFGVFGHVHPAFAGQRQRRKEKNESEKAMNADRSASVLTICLTVIIVVAWCASPLKTSALENGATSPANRCLLIGNNLYCNMDQRQFDALELALNVSLTPNKMI
jgi:hypothetical protein